MKFKHKRNNNTYELAQINGKYHLVVALDTLEDVAKFRKENREIVFGARMTPVGADKKNVVAFKKLSKI